MQGDRKAVRRGPQGRLQACRQGGRGEDGGVMRCPEDGNAVAPSRRGSGRRGAARSTGSASPALPAKVPCRLRPVLGSGAERLCSCSHSGTGVLMGGGSCVGGRRSS